MRYFFWLFLILLVIFRFYITKPIYKNGQKIRITTKITSQPVRYSSYQSLKLAGLKIYLPLYPEISYGDSVVVEGVVSDKKLNNPKLIEIKENREILTSLRKNLLSLYQKSLPEPDSSLLSGIVIGSKSSLPEDFWNSLKKVGLAHVVVASGMNVTFVASFLMTVLVIFLPRRKAITLALAGIWSYSVLSGLEAPIIRAAIMGSLTFAAQEFGRISSAWRILVLSAVLMLIVRPDWIGDIGFILTFTATASLMVFSKRIENRLKFLPAIFREGLATSLAAQIGVGPILFVTFGQFNILSPIINALVLWTIPYIMIIGAVGGGIGLLFPMLGNLILYLAYPMTGWFIGIVRLFS